MKGGLFGCGNNNYNQLFYYSNSENSSSVEHINAIPKINCVFDGGSHSFALSGVSLPKNPRTIMNLYSLYNILEKKINQQNEKILQLEEQVLDLNNKIKYQREVFLHDKEEFKQNIRLLIESIADKGIELTNK